MTAGTPTARVDFCGEVYQVGPERPLLIGREGDLVIDDNPYLHRRFLRLERTAGLWRLVNLGGRLAATVADDNGLVQAWLAPGAMLPVVFPRTRVWFTAGLTTYELTVELDDAPFAPVDVELSGGGSTTIGRTTFTPDQQLLLVALAEPALRHGERGAGPIPANAEVAERLGWSLTKFNRKLDNVCQKLAQHGVRGLHGNPGRLASNRRARLVEYALAARLVSREDLRLLDQRVPDPPPEAV